MTITHSTFLTQVRNFAEVDSNVLTDATIDQFIRNVELDVAGKVDYDDLRKYANSTFTAGNRAVSMPSDVLVLRSVEHLTSGGVRSFLEKRDTSFISEFNASDASGIPKYYANWDEFTIALAPAPNAAFVIQINYIIDPPHFTSSNSTFLSNYQESLLLNGVLAECFTFLKGPMDMYKLYFDRYTNDVQAFALQQMGQKRRGQYDDGVPRIPIQSPSP